ncbi:MAG: antibiotic biosynthesis monooxygenase [Hyphomicrobiales bacterium]|nr:antibiotic biosynthesis monooxygenase [Hyphomicrobiales bacterium]
MIRVVAVITCKPGRREAFIDLFRANVPAVRAEAGCIEYQGVVDDEASGAKYGPDVFVVIETWESLEALKAHAVAPHMKAIGEKTKELVADRAIHILSAI